MVFFCAHPNGIRIKCRDRIDEKQCELAKANHGFVASWLLNSSTNLIEWNKTQKLFQSHRPRVTRNDNGIKRKWQRRFNFHDFLTVVKVRIETFNLFNNENVWLTCNQWITYNKISYMNSSAAFLIQNVCTLYTVHIFSTSTSWQNIPEKLFFSFFFLFSFCKFNSYTKQIAIQTVFFSFR